MEQLVLKFVAPREFNELKATATLEKVSWGYRDDPNAELKLNLDDWTINCEAQGKSSHITKWKVSQDKYSFSLEQDVDGYEQIDLAFAMSMLGQLVNREQLIKYLKQLQDEFEKMSQVPFDDDADNQEDKTNDNINKE
ncbi:hypothetical protein [Capnocytophaga canimorsus]|uniref:hypothetical protein n=1 Tax=Capnocytophaga canimorsus TaxID=28188 RepID=UPI001AD01130|nr:hypothetical protein [Capnocytophaga canimorsus]GIM59641.1 hypothetical protein CAPN007_18500 [Capnocytophaga canimorsus]